MRRPTTLYNTILFFEGRLRAELEHKAARGAPTVATRIMRTLHHDETIGLGSSTLPRGAQVLIIITILYHLYLLRTFTIISLVLDHAPLRAAPATPVVCVSRETKKDVL